MCHITVATTLHRTFRINWTLHRMSPTATVQLLLWFYGQVWLVRVNILFQKLNLRLSDFSLIKKINYMSENVLSQNKVDSEYFRVRRDKNNTLRKKKKKRERFYSWLEYHLSTDHKLVFLTHSEAKQYQESGAWSRECLTAGPHKEKRQTKKAEHPESFQQSTFLRNWGSGLVTSVRVFVLEVRSWSGHNVPVVVVVV